MNKKSFSIIIGTLSVVICYFLYHAISGKSGVLAMLALEERVEIVRVKHDTISKKRHLWDNRVQAMYEHSLDHDLLDERARHILSVAKKGEIVIID